MTEFMFYDLTSWHTNYYEIVVQWIGFMFIILADTNKGRMLVLLVYIDNVYVLCFNIKVRLKGFSNVTCTCTGYITYTMIGFMFIFEPSLI